MIKFIIQFLFIFTIWYHNIKAKGHLFTPSSVLLFIYTICSFMGVIFLSNGNYPTALLTSWESIILFDIFIISYLIPFRKFDETKINAISIPNKKFLDIFSTIIIILSFFSIIFFSQAVVGIFTMGDLGAARNARSANGGMEYFEASLISTIGSVAAANYVFAIVLFFLYSIIGGSKLRRILLLLSSLSEPIQVMAFVGRDGVVFWLFTFAFCYAFFRPFLQENLNSQIKKIFIIGSGILLVPFMLITISRFALSDYMGGGTGNSIIAYLGQPFVQGPLYFDLNEKPKDIGKAFPLFYEATGLSRKENNTSIETGEWVSWGFSTFIVNLYSNLDFVGLVLFTFITMVLFYFSIGNKKGYINLGNYTIYLLLFQIISQGVFYFRHYTRGGNLFIVSTLFLAILFSHSCQHWKDSIILYKKETT